jgi:hypothetical protein
MSYEHMADRDGQQGGNVQVAPPGYLDISLFFMPNFGANTGKATRVTF